MELGCQIEGVLPCGLAVCSCSSVCAVKVVPEVLHVVFDVHGVSSSGVQLGQGPNLCQSSGDLGRITNVFYGGERYGGVSPLVDHNVHEVFCVFTPLEFLLV